MTAVPDYEQTSHGYINCAKRPRTLSQQRAVVPGVFGGDVYGRNVDGGFGDFGIDQGVAWW